MLGALVFRGVFLAAGVTIVNRFTAVLFVFGAILVWSAVKLLRGHDNTVDTLDPGKSLSVRLLRKLIPITGEYHGTKFFVKEAGTRIGTPLLAVVAAIEAADLIFAVNSVPAVLAVSDDAFIVYSSNAFAILGLRALYFLLSGMLERFHHLARRSRSSSPSSGASCSCRRATRRSARPSPRSRRWRAWRSSSARWPCP